MKILVTGAAGMLGRKMLEVLGEGNVVVGAARRPENGCVQGDVTRLDEMRSLVRRVMPQVIVHCAAYTAVDACESNVDQAFMVNAMGTKNVAIAALEANAELFHFSTDYVFDGRKSEPYTEYDTPNPIGVYARSKWASETIVSRMVPRSYIGRIQWLYGEGGKNFVETMVQLSKERPSLSVVDDQWGCPTYTGDVARQAKQLIEAKAYGLYHMSNNGSTTWYRFARAIFDRLGRSDYPVSPIPTSAYPTPAVRPAYSVMRNMNLELTLGDSMRPWETALDDYLARRKD